MQASCATCGMFSRNIDVPSLHILQSPRMAKLLLSNDAPNDAEIERLRQMVQESSALMKSLQVQIEKAKQTISTLRAIYGATSKRLADTKKILHPVRSLPRDILAEIFFACAPIPEEDDRIHFCYSSEFDTLCPRNHPWNLSHVCRAWRETALSLPRLWSTIYLNFGHYHTLPHRQCTFMSTLLFARSANLDLSITLSSDRRSIAGHPLTGCLAASTTRWRTFHCQSSAASLQSFSGLAFPLLQELGVGYYARSVDGFFGREAAVDTFRHASNVRTVTFYDSSDVAESTDMLGPFPWNNVVKISCHVTALESPFRSVLEQAAMLEELVVEFQQVASTWSTDALMLPRLKCLDITIVDDEVSGRALLHSMRLPSIERLALKLPNGDPLTLPRHSEAHPYYNRIKYLRIVQNHPCGDSDVLRFLYHTPGVEELQLAGRMISMQLLHAFGTGNDRILLPSLRVLDLHQSFIEPLTLNDLTLNDFPNIQGGRNAAARGVVASLLLHLIESRCADTDPQSRRCATVRKVIIPEAWGLIAADFSDRWTAVRDFVEVVSGSRKS